MEGSFDTGLEVLDVGPRDWVCSPVDPGGGTQDPRSEHARKYGKGKEAEIARMKWGHIDPKTNPYNIALIKAGCGKMCLRKKLLARVAKETGKRLLRDHSRLLKACLAFFEECGLSPDAVLELWKQVQLEETQPESFEPPAEELPVSSETAADPEGDGSDFSGRFDAKIGFDPFEDFDLFEDFDNGPSTYFIGRPALPGWWWPLAH